MQPDRSSIKEHEEHCNISYDTPRGRMSFKIIPASSSVAMVTGAVGHRCKLGGWFNVSPFPMHITLLFNLFWMLIEEENRIAPLILQTKTSNSTVKDYRVKNPASSLWGTAQSNWITKTDCQSLCDACDVECTQPPGSRTGEVWAGAGNERGGRVDLSPLKVTFSLWPDFFHPARPQSWKKKKSMPSSLSLTLTRCW